MIERDYHLIGDELRQMFVEERDEKLRLAAEELDPGLPAVCPRTCPYLATCHPDLATCHPAAQSRPDIARSSALAKLERAPASAAAATS